MSNVHPINRAAEIVLAVEEVKSRHFVREPRRSVTRTLLVALVAIFMMTAIGIIIERLSAMTPKACYYNIETQPTLPSATFPKRPPVERIA
jgi:hypothetical protein